MHDAKTFLLVLLFLSCSASDNVLNDGSPDGDGGSGAVIIGPINPDPIDATPVKSPSGLSIPFNIFNGAFPLDTPLLSWVNPGPEEYSGLQLGLLNDQNQWVVAFQNLDKETTEHSFNRDFLEECTLHRYVIRGVLNGVKGNPEFSEEFYYDNTAPQGPVSPQLVDDSTRDKSALLSWSDYNENCELYSLESAMTRRAKLNNLKLIPGGEWKPVINNKVERVFTGKQRLKRYKKYYTLIKGKDKAGNEKIYISDSWQPLGPLNKSTLFAGESNRAVQKVLWDEPVNRNAPGKGLYQTTHIRYKRFKREKWQYLPVQGTNLEYAFSKIDLYPCRLLYVQMRTFNGLYSVWSDVLQVPIDYHLDEKRDEFFNLSSDSKSKIFAHDQITEVLLNGESLVQLNPGQSFEFASKVGDHIESNQDIDVLTQSGKRWARPLDFIQELKLGNFAKRAELDVYSQKDQLITLHTIEGNFKKYRLKAGVVQTLQIDGYNQLISDYPVLTYLIKKDQEGNIIQEKLVK